MYYVFNKILFSLIFWHFFIHNKYLNIVIVHLNSCLVKINLERKNKSDLIK